MSDTVLHLVTLTAAGILLAALVVLFVAALIKQKKDRNAHTSDD